VALRNEINRDLRFRSRCRSMTNWKACSIGSISGSAAGTCTSIWKTIRSATASAIPVTRPTSSGASCCARRD